MPVPICVGDHRPNGRGGMSVSDELMWRYLELLSLRSQSELDGLRAGVDAVGQSSRCQDGACGRVDHPFSREAESEQSGERLRPRKHKRRI